jgi:hypothetical protein
MFELCRRGGCEGAIQVTLEHGGDRAVVSHLQVSHLIKRPQLAHSFRSTFGRLSD